MISSGDPLALRRIIRRKLLYNPMGLSPRLGPRGSGRRACRGDGYALWLLGTRRYRPRCLAGFSAFGIDRRQKLGDRRGQSTLMPCLIHARHHASG